jgi:long-chain-fatty-acid--CoA ligase ACSBG
MRGGIFGMMYSMKSLIKCVYLKPASQRCFFLLLQLQLLVCVSVCVFLFHCLNNFFPSSFFCLNFTFVRYKMDTSEEQKLPGEGTLWVTDVHEVRPIQLPPQEEREEGNPAHMTPITLMDAFDNVCEKLGDSPYLHSKEDGEWKAWTFNEYRGYIKQAARAMIKLGVEEYTGVAIMGFNCKQWFVADIASLYVGAIACGVYTTNLKDACKYICEDAKAQIVFAENKAQLAKFSVHELESIKAYVCWEHGFESDVEKKLYSWDDFMALGDESNEALVEELDRRGKEIKPERCCTLIYTSGTTGPPKGVMISHDNITFLALACIPKLEGCPDDIVISYLPLSHIAAQLWELLGSMCCGYQIFFAQANALAGGLKDTLLDVRPTAFLGVPRVWEKMMASMRDIGAKTTGMKKMIASWAKGKGLQAGYSMQDGHSKPWFYSVANHLLFTKVRNAMGFDRCRLCVTAAAPISVETLEFFFSIGLPLVEFFGMSECTGPHTISMPYPKEFRIGYCGKAFPGAELKVEPLSCEKGEDVDEKGSEESLEEGEFVLRGRNIFLGYLGRREETAETFNEEGYLTTGDIAEVHSTGFARITGRLKELIITAGGENVAPVLIEDIIHDVMPFVEHVVLIGDKQKYVTCLMILGMMTDRETGAPTDNLAPSVLRVLKEIGSEAKTIDEAIACPKLEEYIFKKLDEANERVVSRAAKVQKFSIIRTPFTVDGGELTPTMKIKRRVVHRMYEEMVEKMYSDEYQKRK